jgi:hypothetical protein
MRGWVDGVMGEWVKVVASFSLRKWVDELMSYRI